MNQALKVLAEECVEERYLSFMDLAVVKEFTTGGGKVFVASESRAEEDIRVLVEAGHRHFAEKFVREVESKWTRLPRAKVTLHAYGNLQTNKSARACSLFDLIESLGRDSLRGRLVRLRDAGVLPPPLYLQVNVGAEPQKGGYCREEAASALEAARNAGLDVRGVMAIPPRGENPAPHFRWLRRFAERERLQECMMGMSEDFSIAINEGATAIRVGRVIFGPKALGSRG